ncbi:MAG: TraR/DksA family transcriptional regulator [Mycobacteriales bacterium]
MRRSLGEQLLELQAEYTESLAELEDLQQRASDGAGDDQADAGTKTFEREQEMSLANNRRELLSQTQHALDRIDAGTYGLCESCGKPIVKARLQAFPSATLCVACKQREERR